MVEKVESSIFDNIKDTMDKTESLPQAIDIVASKTKSNPHKVYNKLFKNIDKTPKSKPTEKISTGDLVCFNDDTTQQFEVININNKDAIILRNLDSHELCKASQDDIKLITMENVKMAEKLNEATYTVSIDNLETNDASALSQMLSVAAEADNTLGSTPESDITAEPTLPTPEIEEIPSEEPFEVTDMTIDLPEDDIDFDEEITDASFEPVEEDVEELFDDNIDEDILLPKETADQSIIDDEPSDEYELDEETSKMIESIIESGMTPNSYQEDYAEEITEADDEDEDIEHYETCVWCGEDFPKSELKKEKDLGYLCHHCIKGLESREGNLEFEDDLEEAVVKPTIVTDESTFENKMDKGLEPKEESKKHHTPVSTSEFGAEAMEPFRYPKMCCESTINKDKIINIVETAKVRYARSDISSWDALDRRYVTKLMENGCSYSRASKLILEAKKK